MCDSELGDGTVVNGSAVEAGDIKGTNEGDVSELGIATGDNVIETGEDTTEEDVPEAEYATDSEFETASSEDDDEDRKSVKPGPALRRSPRLKKKSEVNEQRGLGFYLPFLIFLS